MLLTDGELRIEGEQGAILAAVHHCLLELLEGTGTPPAEADAVALTLLPRLQDKLAQLGYVVRQLGE